MALDSHRSSSGLRIRPNAAVGSCHGAPPSTDVVVRLSTCGERLSQFTYLVGFQIVGYRLRIKSNHPADSVMRQTALNEPIGRDLGAAQHICQFASFHGLLSRPQL